MDRGAWQLPKIPCGEVTLIPLFPWSPHDSQAIFRTCKTLYCFPTQESALLYLRKQKQRAAVRMVENETIQKDPASKASHHLMC